MNVRFYNAKILCLKDDAAHEYQIIEGELWVRGKEIAFLCGRSAVAELAQRAGVPARGTAHGG